MGRVIVCALATWGVWCLLFKYASGLVSELPGTIALIVLVVIFSACWHFSHK